MLGRLLTQVVDILFLELQCGFCCTADKIFASRLLQEKCREQHHGLYIAFIGFAKALSIVICSCGSWAKWGTLLIFSASYGYGNSMIGIDAALSREERCWRAWCEHKGESRTAS